MCAHEEASQGLFSAIKKKGWLKYKKVLWPRSSLPNPTLKNRLQKNGVKVWDMAIYKTQKPKGRKPIFCEVKGIIFTSPSTVEHFFSKINGIPSSWHIWARGPLTRKALKKRGYESEVLSRE